MKQCKTAKRSAERSPRNLQPDPSGVAELKAAESARAARRTRMIRRIARIRCFEQKLLALFSAGKLFGTTHTTIGQEVVAAALYEHVDATRDAVFTNHRCHGHFLAYGGSMQALMAEIMGKEGGVCGGRGGSQHLCHERFFSQGIQGASMPIAAGYAWMLKRRREGGIAVIHIGDGTLGEGVVYESLNFAKIAKVPLLVILEHNAVAQSTATADTTAGDVAERFGAFGLDVDRRSADEPESLSDHLAEVVSSVRQGRPAVQILDTFRLMAHSKGDDDRPKEQIQSAWKRDYFAGLLENKDPVAIAAREAAVHEVESIADRLEETPLAKLDLNAATLADPARPLFDSSAALLPARPATRPSAANAGNSRINERLGEGLRDCLQSEGELLFLGEDIADPYGGAFKVSRGLSTQFPDQVFSTPISEAAIVGFANGVALAGGKAVAEIMFGDFATLAVDQIVNQAAKMHHMYAGKATVPLVVRLPSGGYRGYGPTHSQSLERMFCGTPGLKVVAISRRHDPAIVLKAATIDDPNPVVFVENKLLYSLPPHLQPPRGFRFIPQMPQRPGDYPPLNYASAEPEVKADCTVVAYGGLTDKVEAAMEQLILQHEWEFDYFVLTQLHPLDPTTIQESVAVSGRLVTVEEAPESYGIGAEVAASVVEAGRPTRVARVGARPMPIPNSRVQEDEALPSVERIVAAIKRVFA